MNPKITNLPEMILVGVVNCAPSVADFGEGPMDISAMWGRLDSVKNQIANAVPDVFYEYHVERPVEPRMHFCLVGMQVTAIGSIPPDMFIQILPPATYAVITHHVINGYGKLYANFNEWLEASDFEEFAPFDFQVYDSRFTSMDDPDSVQDIYIPIQKKNKLR